MKNMGDVFPQNEAEMLRTGIALDYPVSWDMRRILRDLIQNFYDSIGWKEFDREFRMYTDRRGSDRYSLVMETMGRDFSYEWLLYVGGSTKTGSPGEYIGMYGEGFKMCALCLLKSEIKVTMESAEWEIASCKYTEWVGDRQVPMLGYMKKKRENDGATRLTISCLTRAQAELVSEMKLNFYYPQNPLLGEVRYRGKECAIYKRSDVWIPCEDGSAISGILYCNGLARGRLPEDLVLCFYLDMRPFDKRSRETMDDYESLIFLNRVVKKMTPLASYQLLMCLQSYWDDLPQRPADMGTWYYVVCQLVRNIASDRKMKRRFMKKHTDLICLERKNSDKMRNRMIDEAELWLEENEAYRSCQCVNPIFRYLGAKQVFDEYLSAEKEEELLMDKREEQLCGILADAFEQIYPLKVYDKRPEICLKPGGGVDPLRYSERTYKRNRGGRRYVINRLILDRDELLSAGFDRMLVSFSEKMLHVYGRTGSVGLNEALTDLGSGLIDKCDEMDLYRSAWQKAMKTGVYR